MHPTSRRPAAARRGLAIALASALLLAACGRHETESKGGVDASWNPASVSAVKGVPATAIQGVIAQRLAAKPPAPIGEASWRHATRLYSAYGNRPLWLDENGLRGDRTAALLRALAAADSDALKLNAYPLGALGEALGTARGSDHPTAEQLADADVLLTAAYAALGTDLLTGQVNPRSVSQSWHIDPREEHVDSALARTLRAGALDKGIASMRPQDPGYQALREQLQRYRQLAGRGGWPAVPEGRSLKPGDADSPARLQALRQRLAAEGISVPQASAATAGRYDAALAGAVATFQARHAIVVDSVLGAGTVKSMNVPAAYRLGEIAANLERYRWLPRTLGSRYIYVNVPAFHLEAYDQGRKALEMKVIVGAEYEDRATPVFSDSMEYVVFRPYWLVPDSIAAKEIFPKAQADPGYLASHNYETYEENGTTRVRQKPGGENSLGLVKFMFPNDFNIYLHDTPEDQLFQHDVRAFSHGCIRLEKPGELAQWVLGWPADKVQSAMHSGPDDHKVTLPRKIPVYIVYFTTYAKDGQLYFGNDLYNRDDELVQAVDGGAAPSAEVVRAEQALRTLAERYSD